MFNGVIDVSHHNRVANWRRVRRAGVVAVVHKATEGATFQDPLYAERRAAARAAGMLFGSYHFGTAAGIGDQVANYLASADPHGDELICLDFERTGTGNDMTAEGAEAFVQALQEATGRFPVVYGGKWLRGVFKERRETILARCPLWHRRPGSEPGRLPKPWSAWTLWQYTDGVKGGTPREVDGIGPVDRNIFNGTSAELFRRWPF